jgi:hypothetical protein
LSAPDDELDSELRRLFTDDRLAVRPTPDAGQRIVAGAKRRRHHRAVLASAGGMTMAAVLVAGALTIGNLHAENTAAVLAPGALSTYSTLVPGEAGFTYLPASLAPPAPAKTKTPPPRMPGGDETTPNQATRSSATPPAPGLPIVVSGPLIGPDGYGKLKLGMSVEQAATQGVVLVGPQGEKLCKTYTFSGSGVPSGGSAVVSPTAGVAEISPSARVTTPEGVGAGSLKSDVYTAYPGAIEVQPGSVSAPTRGIGRYVFGLDSGGQRVTAMGLENANKDCAGVTTAPG